MEYSAHTAPFRLFSPGQPDCICRYLPWAANSDPRFVSIPERLASAPRHQQLRDSDLLLPKPLVRGLFLQGMQMSSCWTRVFQSSNDTMRWGTTSNMHRQSQIQDRCVEDDALYDGFEANGWPKFELRSQEITIMGVLSRLSYLTLPNRYTHEKMQTWLRDAGWV